jgi:hypothetical protein
LRTAIDIKRENVALLQRTKLIFSNYLPTHRVRPAPSKKALPVLDSPMKTMSKKR